MSLGINNTDETFPLEVKLMDNEVLRVTPDGQFIWHTDADRIIEEGNFNFNPAMPHILRALRKREWVGLSDERLMEMPKQEPVALEAVYETIIHWDEGGGKRSRRELARRIVDLYTTPQPATQDNAFEGLTKAVREFATEQRAIEAKLRSKNT